MSDEHIKAIVRRMQAGDISPTAAIDQINEALAPPAPPNAMEAARFLWTAGRLCGFSGEDTDTIIRKAARIIAGHVGGPMP